MIVGLRGGGLGEDIPDHCAVFDTSVGVEMNLSMMMDIEFSGEWGGKGDSDLAVV